MLSNKAKGPGIYQGPNADQDSPIHLLIIYIKKVLKSMNIFASAMIIPM